jgi:hypothetical protein
MYHFFSGYNIYVVLISLMVNVITLLHIHTSVCQANLIVMDAKQTKRQQ